MPSSSSMVRDFGSKFAFDQLVPDPMLTRSSRTASVGSLTSKSETATLLVPEESSTPRAMILYPLISMWVTQPGISRMSVSFGFLGSDRSSTSNGSTVLGRWMVYPRSPWNLVAMRLPASSMSSFPSNVMSDGFDTSNILSSDSPMPLQKWVTILKVPE